MQTAKNLFTENWSTKNIFLQEYPEIKGRASLRLNWKEHFTKGRDRYTIPEYR
jgi:hypothetical protein